MSDVQDGYPADIIAAFRKRGTTLAAVSREAGLESNTLTNVFARRWSRCEQIIAEALNCSPAEKLRLLVESACYYCFGLCFYE
ncbi:helix-turn-helix domain-containing protein [Photorhabdus bodei]|uniref:Helix-turn-helix domain-containing protein n=1 Tax=Photorhabdus bodei TaxID=2029681 RepID=A0AAW6BRE8_9GAMM|nr:helix-turn-helix domain-containing protein [Photorhabdus bodei]MDB6374255.1 helix-turn-helix domain-containing protein [Photorhabdus bodei]